MIISSFTLHQFPPPPQEHNGQVFCFEIASHAQQFLDNDVVTEDTTPLYDKMKRRELEGRASKHDNKGYEWSQVC
jgi:hypothetical protein